MAVKEGKKTHTILKLTYEPVQEIHDHSTLTQSKSGQAHGYQAKMNRSTVTGQS